MEHIQVCFWPMLVARRTSHGARRADGLPEYVAPIAAAGLVAREDGRVRPTRTVIARDVLEPLPAGAFSIGTVADLDAFLTESPFSLPSEGEQHDEAWRRYRNDCKRLLDVVTGGWPNEDDEYEKTGTGLIETAGDGAATTRQILALYDNILTTWPKAPLLETYAASEKRKAVPCLGPTYAFAGRLGHGTASYPLADGQRDVLAHLVAAKDGEILAVNGPPGTGKTSMLLSAVAGEWVRTARAGGEPPVIAAASTNNQAVTNIIDAFGKEFGRGDGDFAGRWLPGIESFGVYLPARSRDAKASQVYQTESFFEGLETEEYVRRARAAYLTAAKTALPELRVLEVEAVVDALRERIDREAGKLEGFDAALGELELAQAEVERVLGTDPETGLGALDAERDRSAREEQGNRELLDGWEKYLARESIFLSLFSFLPPVSRKRRLKAGLFLKEAGYGGHTGIGLRIREVETVLRRSVAAGRERLRTADGDLARGKAAMDRLVRGRMDHAVAAKEIDADVAALYDVVAQELSADCGIRFRLFLLATHYWEGRWLLEMMGLLPHIENERPKKGEKTVARRWRRRMMLTPCMVSTFATLPGKMTISRFENEKFHDDHLFNFIDLLIVDEAGQCSPEVAGAAFALAKKALVIGDTRQIEPIAVIPKSVDIGNLVESGALNRNYAEEDLDRLDALGLTSTGGSAMRIAQTACRYHSQKELDRGLWLFEHRRSYDEIIQYCNTLCYEGKLEPCRGPAPAKGPVGSGTVPGPLAYLHVDGICVAAGGSRRNRLEARTIAAWLAAERGMLERAYGKRLEEIVGVVTPFGGQVREIRQACREEEISVSEREGMTVGTVHALQGADREIVIFSPAYSKHADGEFIDMSPSMLNVAVSRAKDAFLVFGDMDLFSTARRGSPRQLLGEFLFGLTENALEFQSLPRDDLERTGHEIRTLRDAKEHDAFLLELLADGGVRKVSIVSPWISVETMRRSGILAALGAAKERGMEIEVYVDPALSSEGGTLKLEEARAALGPMGVVLKEVGRLHSKIVLAGETLLSVGSYNWLSAKRSGMYARHETSLVYRGSHLSAEIEAITESLRRRVVMGGR